MVSSNAKQTGLRRQGVVGTVDAKIEPKRLLGPRWDWVETPGVEFVWDLDIGSPFEGNLFEENSKSSPLLFQEGNSSCRFIYSASMGTTH